MSNEIRVLQIGLSRMKGGVESCILNYSYELAKYGIVFDYVDIYGEGIAISKEIYALNGKIFTLPSFKRYFFKAQKELKQIILSGEYKIVHFNMLSAANLLPVKVALDLGIIPIIHAHNTCAVGFIRKFLNLINLKRINNFKIMRLACGEKAGKWFYKNKQFKVIPNAVNVERFLFSTKERNNIRNIINVSADELLVGFVGRLDYQKNIFYLFRIFEYLKDINPSSKLLIIGDGPMRTSCEEYIRSKHLEEYIILAGKQNDVEKWYSAMDVFVLPSLFEGLPVVALEAQASGLPCVLSQNITDEVIICENVRQCGINDEDLLEWAKTIVELSLRNFDRTTGNTQIGQSIYNIDKAVSLLMEIYERY